VSVQMRRKGVGLDKIYDARALRVVVGDGGKVPGSRGGGLLQPPQRRAPVSTRGAPLGSSAPCTALPSSVVVPYGAPYVHDNVREL